MQARNRDTDVENKCMATKGGKWRGGGVCVMNWEIVIDRYTLMCIKLMTNKNLLYKRINKIKFKKQTNKKVCTIISLSYLYTAPIVVEA